MNIKLLLKRILFYVISFTWGGIMSIIGLVVLLITLPFGKIEIYHGRLYKRIGDNWGGLELGCFFLCDNQCGEHTLAHEVGHGLQNCIWGPLFPFVIGIPSALRYWLFNQTSQADREAFVLFIGAVWTLGSITACTMVVFTPLIWLLWLVIGISLYGVILVIWMWFFELKTWVNNSHPGYDTIWFEGQATNWGFKYIATDKI